MKISEYEYPIELEVELAFLVFVYARDEGYSFVPVCFYREATV